MAQGLSLLHNNGIYMGARGFVMYRTDNNGNPSINGVSGEQYKNLNDGVLILYRNGKQLGQIKLPWNPK